MALKQSATRDWAAREVNIYETYTNEYLANLQSGIDCSPAPEVSRLSLEI